jgi:hypothetical protein
VHLGKHTSKFLLKETKATTTDKTIRCHQKRTAKPTIAIKYFQQITPSLLTWSTVRNVKVLVFKCASVDALSSGAVSIGEIWNGS